MRILVVGAGGIGGYFGGRLLSAGRDVTFLVRERRAAQLAGSGLVVRSPFGDLDLPAPPTVTTDALDNGLGGAFDLVLLSCKAYDLDAAMESVAGAIGPNTAMLPLLNGMRHRNLLEARFGAGQVLGGLCLISTVLDPDGRVLHLNDIHTLSFGESDGASSPRIEAIAATLSDAGFDARLSDAIVQEMWEKWIFIATGAGATCLMRAAIGDIVAAGATDVVTALLDESAAIATAQGFPPRQSAIERTRDNYTRPGSTMTASMLRDIERGGPIEADHIIGDLLRRGGNPAASPMLGIVHAHLKAYEARRARETVGS
jgi:2-dehydropantoate 2-reductase